VEPAKGKEESDYTNLTPQNRGLSIGDHDSVVSGHANSPENLNIFGIATSRQCLKSSVSRTFIRASGASRHSILRFDASYNANWHKLIDRECVAFLGRKREM